MKLILDKILNQLRNPYKIFQKFYEFYFFFRYKIFYNESLYIKNQNILFEKNLLNRKTGLNKIKYIKTKYPFLNSPMSSEHQVIFSSLSKKKNFRRKKKLFISRVIRYRNSFGIDSIVWTRRYFKFYRWHVCLCAI